MSNRNSRILLSISVSIFVIVVLSLVQIKLEKPMILAERFYKGSGWIEIILIALYGGSVAWNMQDKSKTAKWRRYTWALFSIVFFTQLAIGLLGQQKFLMTGKLHLPIPMMIIAGPIYREQISFMTILFLSTIVLTGPAWCSHLCYFGAFDAYAASRKRKAGGLNKINRFKFPVLIIIILAAILLRIFKIPVLISTLLAGLFGIIGLVIIIILSNKKGKMVHCTAYCPVGTVVNYLRFINPFRFRIAPSCDACMKCTVVCKYNALNKINILKKEPGITCTLCGDCVNSCHVNALGYKFFSATGDSARNYYLFITISVHAVFMALARI